MAAHFLVHGVADRGLIPYPQGGGKGILRRVGADARDHHLGRQDRQLFAYDPHVLVHGERRVRPALPQLEKCRAAKHARRVELNHIGREARRLARRFEHVRAALARQSVHQMQAEADVIVLGGMGLKYDDFLYFKDALSKGGALSKTVMFIHTASDPTVECMMIPDMVLAVAEQFALQNKDVLVLLTDMTNFADAMKEIAITQEQVPSNRGYPGDLYSQLASRYEKAVDFADSGSVTVLAVTTMPGDDVTHPVPDNTGYITEGQYYLKGGRIEPFGSLSRLKQNVNGKTRKDHRALMDAMIRLYSSYKETLEKKNMGFSMSRWDEKLLKYGGLFESKLMSLSVNLPLEDALDLGWEILADCFEKDETGIKSDLTDEFWPKG